MTTFGYGGIVPNLTAGKIIVIIIPIFVNNYSLFHEQAKVEYLKYTVSRREKNRKLFLQIRCHKCCIMKLWTVFQINSEHFIAHLIYPIYDTWVWYRWMNTNRVLTRSIFIHRYQTWCHYISWFIDSYRGYANEGFFINAVI